MIRRRVVFTGHVQGVGFRYTTCRVAERFQVTGFVKNLPDRRVEVVAEGKMEEVEGFLRAVGDEMGDCIVTAQSQDEPAIGEFRDFDVRY